MNDEKDMNDEKELLKQANKIRVMRGDWDSLLKLKRQILSLNKNCDEIYYIVAQYLTENGDYNLAEKNIKKAISLNKKKQEYFDLHTKILMKWILCCEEDEKLAEEFREKRNKDLKKSITESIKLKPTALNYLNLAFYHFSNKAYKSAIKACDKSIELDDRNSYTFGLRAYYKKEIKDYKGAIEDYKKSAELDPNDWAIYNDIAQVYIAMSNSEKALEYLDIAIEKCPPEDMKYYDMYSAKAQLLETLERYEESLAAQLKHDEIWLKEFGEIQSYTTTGWGYYKVKQYKQALKYFNKAIKKNNEDYWAYLDKACIFLDTKKFKKAIKICDYALSLNLPKKSKYGFYSNKGLAYYYLKDFNNALKNFKISIKENPKDLNTSLIKAYTGHILGKTNKAIKEITKLVEKLPDNEIYLGYLLAIYYSRKEFSKIIELCNKFLETKQKDNIYLFKALASKELGDEENFKINFQKAIESGKELTEEKIIEEFAFVYNIKLEK